MNIAKKIKHSCPVVSLLEKVKTWSKRMNILKYDYIIS